MTKDTKFKPGQSGNPATQFKAGNPHRFGPGVSGNIGGKSKYRTQFEEAFNDALVTQGSPEEAAQLLWEAARSKEPWAIQNICQRFAPQTQNLNLTHEVNNDGIDYSKFTDEQIEQLESILEQADHQPLPLESGEGTPPVA